MDHVRFGKQLARYIYPPNIPTTEEVFTFKDALQEIVEEKLCLLSDRDSHITHQNEARIRGVQKLTKPESLEEWFCLEYAAAVYEEHFYIYKWQKYWLSILDKINPRKIASSVTQTLDIEGAKQFSIVQLYPNELRKIGNRFNGLCPFHKERTPSFFIFPENRFYCYGCNENGDSIDFLMKTKGYDFKEAVRSLNEQY